MVELISARLTWIAGAQDFALPGAGAREQTSATEIVSYDTQKVPSRGNLRLKLQREDNTAELNAAIFHSNNKTFQPKIKKSYHY